MEIPVLGENMSSERTCLTGGHVLLKDMSCGEHVLLVDMSCW